MAEETALVDEKKLTEPCANPNTGVNSPFERSISESRGTKDISGEHTAAGCLIMGASLQPSKGTSKALEAQKEPPKRDDSYPSSLRSTSTSCSSYSLEISVSTATTNNSAKESRPLPLKTPPESRAGQSHDAKAPSSHDDRNPVSAVTKSYEPKPVQEKERLSELKFTQCLDTHGTSEIVTPKSSRAESSLDKTFLSTPSGEGKVGAQSISTCQPLKASSTQHESFSREKKAVQEEEDVFYAFVILHAQEDIEEAVRLKSRLESISSTIGATFAEDFEMPGVPTFKSVEDAIENSAYIMLLLTPNFNSHLNETNTDSVLMNSIEKPQKYNTVIPLLPRTNCLTRDQMRPILRTKNPLDETKDRDIFEKVVRKVLDSKNILRQKSMWRQAQQIKKQQKKQLELQGEREYLRNMHREAAKVRELEQEVLRLRMQQQFQPPPNDQQSYPYQGFNGRNQPPSHMLPSSMPLHYSGNTWQQPASNICIQNAKYIMVGNNSTMTVGGVVDSGDEDNL